MLDDGKGKCWSVARQLLSVMALTHGTGRMAWYKKDICDKGPAHNWVVEERVGTS